MQMIVIRSKGNQNARTANTVHLQLNTYHFTLKIEKDTIKASFPNQWYYWYRNITNIMHHE